MLVLNRYEGARTSEALAEFVNSEGGKSLHYSFLFLEKFFSTPVFDTVLTGLVW